MKYTEYGAENRDVMILLHGGGLGPWNYRKEAEVLAQKFHVILPVLDGHRGSGRNFLSIEENARTLLAFIDDRFGGNVLLLGGLSLGGQIVAEMLSLAQRNLQICHNRKRTGSAYACYSLSYKAHTGRIVSFGEETMVCKTPICLPPYET